MLGLRAVAAGLRRIWCRPGITHAGPALEVCRQQRPGRSALGCAAVEAQICEIIAAPAPSKIAPACVTARDAESLATPAAAVGSSPPTLDLSLSMMHLEDTWSAASGSASPAARQQPSASTSAGAVALTGNAYGRGSGERPAPADFPPAVFRYRPAFRRASDDFSGCGGPPGIVHRPKSVTMITPTISHDHLIPTYLASVSRW